LHRKSGKVRASLTVSKPKNRVVYLNGDYDNPAGNSSKDTFPVPSGGNIAETLNSNREVDFRNRFRVGPTDTSVTIALDSVDPPEQI
jgi:hypothetical protein